MAGSSLFWDATYPTFPATEGWALTYYLTGPVKKTWAGATYINASGQTYQVRIPATQTDDLTTAGAYRLIGRVSLAGEVHEVYNERLLVLADPAAAGAAKSFNRQMLESIDAALLAWAPSAEMQSFSVNGRSIEYRTKEELFELRATYAYLVALEDNPDGRLSHAVTFVG